MRALALAKVDHPELKPELLASGLPEYVADNTLFGKSDFAKIDKETRQWGTKINEKLNLAEIHPRYDSQNERGEPLTRVILGNAHHEGLGVDGILRVSTSHRIPNKRGKRFTQVRGPR
jgi:hypothetical protein